MNAPGSPSGDADVRADASAPPGRQAVTGSVGEPRRRRRRRRREDAMVPDAVFESYYGKPILKKPTWSELDIAGYLFLGGLAGGSSVLAAGAELTGRPQLARNAKLGCAGGNLGVSGGIDPRPGPPGPLREHAAGLQAKFPDEYRHLDPHRLRAAGRYRRRHLGDWAPSAHWTCRDPGCGLARSRRGVVHRSADRRYRGAGLARHAPRTALRLRGFRGQCGWGFGGSHHPARRSGTGPTCADPGRRVRTRGSRGHAATDGSERGSTAYRTGRAIDDRGQGAVGLRAWSSVVSSADARVSRRQSVGRPRWQARPAPASASSPAGSRLPRTRSTPRFRNVSVPTPSRNHSAE